jgi:hypothetical protein
MNESDLLANCEKWSKHTILLTPSQVSELGIQAFDSQVVKLIRKPTWQGTDVKEAVQISNIFYAHGLAPRTYEVGESHGYTYIVQERLQKMGVQNEKRLFEVADKYGIVLYEGDHSETQSNEENWFDGKYVDFGGCFFREYSEYKEMLFSRIDEITHFGKLIDGRRVSYQSVPEASIVGKRATSYRIKTMGLDSIDFKGKTVVDIGCNLGVFLHYAFDRGATCFGYDLYPVIQVAQEYLGLTNRYGITLDVLPIDGVKQTADIVFYLAMSEYLGFPDWLKEITTNTLYYEGHAHDSKQETETQLYRLFPIVEYLGTTDDRSERLLYKCKV